MEVAAEQRKEVEDLFQMLNPDNVFKAGKAGLFSEMLPNRTITFKGDPCKGGKQSKGRPIVFIGPNMTATENPCLPIGGKHLNPRCSVVYALSLQTTKPPATFGMANEFLTSGSENLTLSLA